MTSDVSGAVTRPTVSMVWAGEMMSSALAKAESMSAAVTVVVVDESGVLRAMTRMDQAPLVSVQTGINKAYAAAAMGMPTDDFYSAIQADAGFDGGMRDAFPDGHFSTPISELDHLAARRGVYGACGSLAR